MSIPAINAFPARRFPTANYHGGGYAREGEKGSTLIEPIWVYCAEGNAAFFPPFLEFEHVMRGGRREEAAISDTLLSMRLETELPSSSFRSLQSFFVLGAFLCCQHLIK